MIPSVKSTLQEMEEKTMDYEAGYVYELMEKGGPTDVRELIIRIIITQGA